MVGHSRLSDAQYTLGGLKEIPGYAGIAELAESNQMYDRRKPRVDSAQSGPSRRPRQQTPPLPPEDSALAQSAGQPESGPQDPSEEVIQLEGVYIISVAARILDMHPQTLRKYERLGLINPGRTIGMLRLYSPEDLQRVRLIRHLVDRMGLNLAGVEHTLGMVEALLAMKGRLVASSESRTMADRIEQEVSRLFRDMGLPVDE